MDNSGLLIFPFSHVISTSIRRGEGLLRLSYQPLPLPQQTILYKITVYILPTDSERKFLRALIVKNQQIPLKISDELKRKPPFLAVLFYLVWLFAMLTV
jgi:hypothetical protein